MTGLPYWLIYMATKPRQITRSAANGLVRRVLDNYSSVRDIATTCFVESSSIAIPSGVSYLVGDSSSNFTSIAGYFTVVAVIIAAGSYMTSYIASLNKEEKREESSDLEKYVRKYGLHLVEDPAPGITYQ